MLNVSSFQPHSTIRVKATRVIPKTRAGTPYSIPSTRLLSTSNPPNPTTINQLKEFLYSQISTVKKLQDLEGTFSVDFGVKGGELNSKTGAPQKLNFYSISENVGVAADTVFDTVNALADAGGTVDVTRGWGDKDN